MLERPALHVVDDELPEAPPAKAETVAERVRRLQAEAKQLAKDHVRALGLQMEVTRAIAQEILDGGDAYAPGARMLARTLINDLDLHRETLAAITMRAK